MGDKKIFKNYVYNLLYQIVTIILPTITTPYLSRVLGAENIGIYGYVTSIVAYFTLIGALGINKYGQREIAYVQDNVEKRSKVFWELCIIKTTTILLATCVFYFTFCINGEYSFYYKLLLLEIVATLLDISWFFQGIENFKKVVIRNLVVKAISVILVFVLVKDQYDFVKYLLIFVLSNFLGNGIFWLDLRKHVKIVKITFKDLKRHIRPIISLFIPQIATSIYTVLDKTMIGNLSDSITEVGFYEQSQKIIKIALTLVTTMSIVMLPRISNTFAKGNNGELNKYMSKSFRFGLFLSLPIVFGIIAIAPNLVPWFFGKGYEKIINLLIIGSPIIIFISFSTTIGTQYLVSVKKQNVQTVAVVTGAIINCILNFILIPIYDSIGATIATIIAEFCITSIEIIYIVKKKIISLKDIFSGMFKYTIAAIIMYACVRIISNFLQVGVIYTAMQILLGAVVYLGLLFILKDEFLINIVKGIVKNKSRKDLNT